MKTISTSKQCKHCGGLFDVLQEDIDFYAKISPHFGNYTAHIPSPTLCPDCRQRRRMAFRNERKLYKKGMGRIQEAYHFDIFARQEIYRVGSKDSMVGYARSIRSWSGFGLLTHLHGAVFSPSSGCS